jgi:hypothetical protein
MAYLKPTGNACYDETGLTFPIEQKINWEETPVSRLWWLSFFENTPLMACFADQEQDNFDAWLREAAPDLWKRSVIYLGSP